MTVAEFIEFLKNLPPDIKVAYTACSEQRLLEPEMLKLLRACHPRPDGWVQNQRPDKATEQYLVIPGN